MEWTVIASPTCETWLLGLPREARIAIFADIHVLEEIGPHLGRPYVDHIKGSKHSNMKELRTKHDRHQYRILFAFDTVQHAILLVGGDKKGTDQGAFYRALIKIGDVLFDQHLARLKAALKKGTKP